MEGVRGMEVGRGMKGGREGENIDCSMEHHVTMTYDLANTLYGMLIIYCNFPINLIILATKQLKVFKMVIITSPQRQKF